MHAVRVVESAICNEGENMIKKDFLLMVKHSECKPRVWLKPGDWLGAAKIMLEVKGGSSKQVQVVARKWGESIGELGTRETVILAKYQRWLSEYMTKIDPTKNKAKWDPHGIGAVDPRTLLTGTEVDYFPVLPDPDKSFPPIRSKTRTPAWDLGHCWLVSIEGKSGGMDTRHVRPVGNP